MKLYHGSYTKITEVDLSKGERYRDFGQGFYATAADLFYSSKTFARLEDKNTLLHLKPWSEIYEMLKKELPLL